MVLVCAHCEKKYQARTAGQVPPSPCCNAFLRDEIEPPLFSMEGPNVHTQPRNLPLRRSSNPDVIIAPDIEMEPTPICLVCRAPLEGQIVECAKCTTPAHEDCWAMNGRCSIFGCMEASFLKKVKFESPTKRPALLTNTPRRESSIKQVLKEVSANVLWALSGAVMALTIARAILPGPSEHREANPAIAPLQRANSELASQRDVLTRQRDDLANLNGEWSRALTEMDRILRSKNSELRTYKEQGEQTQAELNKAQNGLRQKNAELEAIKKERQSPEEPISAESRQPNKADQPIGKIRSMGRFGTFAEVTHPGHFAVGDIVKVFHGGYLSGYGKIVRILEKDAIYENGSIELEWCRDSYVTGPGDVHHFDFFKGDELRK